MKKILLVLLCFLTFPLAASHIVGGEFEIIHLSGYRYRINLVLYFDELNGSVGARDPSVDARIFRKRDNALMMDVFLPLQSQSPVSYTQPACSNGEIVTTRILYSGVVTLSPAQFADAQGYYLSWERCCRNYSITNIYSDNPVAGTRYAGQTFYLEFPPVVKNGEPFVNSSPRLFPPLNDYACPRRPYYVDFAGVDDDGDSLVYTIVTPMNTKTADALPPPDFRPRPRPYPLVSYRPPFGEANILGGAPDLRISRDGFLTVTPTVLGLFVFAVRCEEYRDGVKIGELRRDFQMLVVDGCNPAEPPKVLGKKMTDGAFTYNDAMTVTFSNDVADTERCIQVEVSDADALREDDGFSENVTIRAIPLNISDDVSGILPEITSATLRNGSTQIFDICFDRCPYIEGPFQVGIIAYDDACSLPLSDTLKVTVNIEPPDNADAYFTTPDVTDFILEGESRTYPIAAVDDDGDPLVWGVIAEGFNLADAGMRIETLTQTDGSYTAQLVWDAFCDIYDFTGRTSFKLTVFVDDIDECNFSHPDAMVFHLNVQLPGNNSPVISTDLTEQELKEGITREIFESVSFNVYGDDATDNDQLVLKGLAQGFNMFTYDMTFPQVSGRGHVESVFNWKLLCDKLDLTKRDTFALKFIVVDNANKCRIYKADTLDVVIRAKPPNNAAPLLTVASTDPDLPFINMRQDMVMGQQVSLGLTSTDADVAPADHIVIDMVSAEGSVEPEGYLFERVEGIGNIQTTFTWHPDCSIFADGVYENSYKFVFRTYDDRCQSATADTVAVEFTIRDVENDIVAFLPPNFVSPDRDPGLRNEFFGMVALNPITGELEDILPKDNCLGVFVGITIYNRWGKVVFESTQRDFRWYPDEEASGVYFYTLTYSDKEFKGSVTVRN